MYHMVYIFGSLHLNYADFLNENFLIHKKKQQKNTLLNEGWGIHIIEISEK